MSIDPPDGSVGIGIEHPVRIQFNKSMDRASVEQSVKVFDEYGNEVDGYFSWAKTIFPDDTVTFVPARPLKYSLCYQIHISGSCFDANLHSPLNGHYCGKNSEFCTQVAPWDNSAPRVIAVYPHPGQVGRHTFFPGVLFSKPIDPTTATPQNVSLAGPGVNGYRIEFLEGSRRLIIRPYQSLEPNSDYTITISGALTDTAGNALDHEYQWSFNTGEGDTIRPQVTQTLPQDGASAINPTTSVLVYFSEEIDPTTVDFYTVKIVDQTDGREVPIDFYKAQLGNENGSLSYLSINPIFAHEWTPGHTFQVKLSPGISDLHGNTLQAEYAFTFTTGSPPNTAPKIDLDDCIGIRHADGSTGLKLSLNARGDHNENLLVEATDMSQANKSWRLERIYGHFYTYESTSDEGLNSGAHVIVLTVTDSVNGLSSSIQVTVNIGAEPLVLSGPSDRENDVSCTPTLSWFDSNATYGYIYDVTLIKGPNPHLGEVVWRTILVGGTEQAYSVTVPACYLLDQGRVYHWQIVKRRYPFACEVTESPIYSFKTLGSDTDGDGVPDQWEEANNLNINSSDAFDDADGDGFSNYREFVSDTDPHNPQDIPPILADPDLDRDTDGLDLVVFAQEMNRDDCSASKPCNCDLDGDGDVDAVDLMLFTEDFGRIQ